MSSKEPQPNDAEKNIEIWKVKKLIKRLEAARGNGTSMISLIIRTCHLSSPLLSSH
jgi:peptide chain release factor subunit 1